MSTETIRIVVTESGAPVVARNIAAIGGSALTSARSLDLLRNALVSVSAGLGIGQLKNLIDAYINLQNRVGFVTEGTAQLNVVTKDLFKTARETRASLDTTVDTYSRMKFALDVLGKSSNEVIAVTRTLNQMVALGGSTVQEAGGALRQYSQFLSGGRLQMQEWNSIAEQIPPLAKAIADEVGIQVAEMKNYLKDNTVSAAQGFRAIQKAAAQTEQAFLKSTPSIAQMMQNVKTAFIEALGEMNKTLGASTLVQQAFSFIENNAKAVLGAMLSLSAGIATVLIPALAAAAVRLLAFGAIANPFAALIGAAVAVGVAMFTLGDDIKVAEGKITDLRDVAGVAWEDIKVGITGLIATARQQFPLFNQAWEQVGKQLPQSFGEGIVSVAKMLDFLYSAFIAAKDTILENWRLFPQAFFEVVYMGLQKVYQILKDWVNKAIDILGSLFERMRNGDFTSKLTGQWTAEFGEASTKIGRDFGSNLAAELEKNKSAENYVLGLLERSDAAGQIRHTNELARIEAEKKAREELGVGKTPAKVKDFDESKTKKKGFGDYLRELERESELALLTGDAYKIANEQIEFANKLRRDLTETEKASIATVVLSNAERERQRQLLTDIKGPTEEYNLGVGALNSLYATGAITLDEYNTKFFQLRENFLNGLPEATTFADGFARQIERMQNATRNGFATMGADVAKIFGPGGTLINGIGDAVAQSIVFGKSFKEQIRGVAQSILSQLIGSLVKMGLNMILNATLGQTLMTASTASGIGQAAALTAAYTPAAAMSSLATGGANAAGAGAGISSIFSILASLGGSLFGATKGFSEGGYTGAIGTSDVAGLVHGQEFVINAQATKRNRSLLEAINAGKDPIAPVVAAAQSAPVSVSITNEIPDAAYEVRSLGEAEIEIIARRIVRRETPDIIANDIRNPNSRTSKSMSASTYAGRRR